MGTKTCTVRLMLARDVDLSNTAVFQKGVDYPPTKDTNRCLIVQPKLNGIRAALISNMFFGRSGDSIKNRVVQNAAAYLEGFSGIDCELIEGDILSRQSLRHSAIYNSAKKIPKLINVYIFDCFALTIQREPYTVRMRYVVKKLLELCPEGWDSANGIRSSQLIDIGCEGTYLRLHCPELRISENTNEFIQAYLDFKEVHEGIIARDPSAIYKFGRTGKTGYELLRMKPFDLKIGIVTNIQYKQANHNPVELDAFGNIKRSTSKLNKVDTDEVGALVVRDLHSNQEVVVGPGKLTQNHKAYYGRNPQEIINKKILYKVGAFSENDHDILVTFQRFVEE